MHCGARGQMGRGVEKVIVLKVWRAGDPVECRGIIPHDLVNALVKGTGRTLENPIPQNNRRLQGAHLGEHSRIRHVKIPGDDAALRRRGCPPGVLSDAAKIASPKALFPYR